MSYFGDATGEKLAQLATNTIRVLSAEGVQAANSGHPGLPMGSADIAQVLWSRFLNVDPKDPNWINRDRFVLSAGHGSMLVYSLLHLAGFDLPLDELKKFRQLGSLTPGHPEYGHTAGVDTTTGPLGAGFSNAVGFAIAEQMLGKQYNDSRHKLVDHFTYVISGDGCMMEGVTSEAASLAGHLKLGKLVVFYDDNEISIEGSTDLAFTEDVNKRFQSYGWHVQDIDGHDHEAIASAVEKAQADKRRPSLIVCHTKIGKGSPNKEGKASAHGEPLGADELAATKKNLGWPEEGFVVPQAVTKMWDERRAQWAAVKKEWEETFADFESRHSRKAKEFRRVCAGELPKRFHKSVDEFPAGKSVATRSSGGEVLNMLAKSVPELVGGSADLAPSTKTELKGYDFIAPGKFAGRNIHFGVREHAMGGIANGMALHGGLIPFCATFMVFCDYMRPTMRLAALMKQRVIFDFTHDSIFVGEDGPTHQPVEHLASMRIIPGLRVMRPCDANETAVAFCQALDYQGPTVTALTRQNLPTLDRSSGEFAPSSMAKKGGYILKEAPSGRPDMLLIASGSEVHTALGAYDLLVKAGRQPRVVSMMCMELFEEQNDVYKRKVLPRRIKQRISIEASLEPQWNKYVGDKGLIIGMEDFGASGPMDELAVKFGFTPEAVVEKIKDAGML